MHSLSSLMVKNAAMAIYSIMQRATAINNTKFNESVFHFKLLNLYYNGFGQSVDYQLGCGRT